MRLILKTLLAGTLAIAAISAETKTPAMDYTLGSSARPKAVRTKIKPLKWLRRACSAEVEFPLWLSSRGISTPEVKVSNENQTFRFAVQPENVPEVTGAAGEE